MVAIVTADISFRDDDVALTWSLLNRGKSRKALGIARRADLQKPGDPWVLEALASAQLACGKTTDAAETASRLIQLIPQTAAAYDLRGRVDLKRRRFVDAEAFFRHALTLDPGNPSLINNLGVALREQNRKEEARAAFEAAWRINPTNPKARKNLFTSTQAYVGAGGVAAFIFWLHFWPLIAHAAKLPAAVEDILFLGGMALTIAGFWWIGWRRRRTLSPDVDRLYRQQLGRERKMELLRGLYKAGPFVVIVLVLVALILSDAPNIFVWISIGTIAWVAWIVIGPRLWRRYIEPGLRS
jgi:tetratricopeptide (TPR) repeat protein